MKRGNVFLFLALTTAVTACGNPHRDEISPNLANPALSHPAAVPYEAPVDQIVQNGCDRRTLKCTGEYLKSFQGLTDAIRFEVCNNTLTALCLAQNR